MSGSLVLDRDFSGVCGVVKANDHRSVRGTAWIVPVEEVLRAFADLTAANAVAPSYVGRSPVQVADERDAGRHVESELPSQSPRVR